MRTLEYGRTRTFSHTSNLKINHVKIMPGKYGITLMGSKNYERHYFEYIATAEDNPGVLYFYVGKEEWNYGSTDVRTKGSHWNSLVSRDSIIASSSAGLSQVYQNVGLAQITCLELYDAYDGEVADFTPTESFANQHMRNRGHFKNLEIEKFFTEL